MKGEYAKNVKIAYEKMRFSIIIPVYNVEKYLDKCILNVMNQTFTDFEVILIDDGSTDTSGMKCDLISKTDSRIKVFHQKNSGSSVARNEGIRIANGEYIIFLDSDDFWINYDLLAILDKKICKNGADVISFNYCKVTGNKMGKPYFPIMKDMPDNFSKERKISFIADNGIWGSSSWNKVIKSELFYQHDLYFRKGITSEDIDWSFRVAIYADTFDYVGITGLAYVQRENSISHSITIEKVKQLESNINVCEKLLKNVTKDKEKILYPYLAYQVGILMVNVALIKDYIKDEQKNRDVRRLLKYLKYSKNKKLQLFGLIVRFFGLNNGIHLLGIIYQR